MASFCIVMPYSRVLAGYRSRNDAVQLLRTRSSAEVIVDALERTTNAAIRRMTP